MAADVIKVPWQITPFFTKHLVSLGNITRRASNSEVHLHTPTSRRDAVQQKVPFSLIRCSSSKAKGAFCSRVA